MADTDTRLVQGRYRLHEVIGRGGMGEVWRATDESLGRRVAVKCLRPLGQQRDPANLAVLRERFRREARVAASLQHRGITVVHDFGESDGVLFLVMELLDGRNLSQLLADNRKRPLPVAEVVDIAEQVADALAYTHRQGVVHRDLKPANIVRLADGPVKICDFGIARLGADIGFTSRLTGTGIAMGTPHYMSPEQIGGGEVDHRSDLYSLGCVLYELATGVPPFDLGDTWSILIGHRDTTPLPLRSHRAELPDYLDLVVLDLLAKTPDGRPADAAVLRDRLAAGRAATASAVYPAPTAPPAPPALPAWARAMGTGRAATTTLAGRAMPPYDPTTALTGEWTRAARPTTSHQEAAQAEDPLQAQPHGHFEDPLRAQPHGHSQAEVQVTGGAPSRPQGTGPNHPRHPSGAAASAPELVAVLAGRHRAGLGLGRLGRWEEAAELLRTVVRDRARVLGADHPDTLASGYELAFALARLGRPAEALRQFGAVAEGRARTLGTDHPETLAARQETAYVLGGLGRHAEAHAVYEAVLAVRERTMGPEHPDTLRCRHNLAFTLGRIGRVAEAYATACEVADARARLLGAEHPDTLATRHEVGHALGRLGRWSDALRHYREIAGIRGTVLGPDHPDTLAARYEAGICLGRLGRAEEAAELYRELVAARTRTAGPEDPETLRARHGLGVNLGRLGRWEEALAEARAVCAARTRVLGADHSDTLVSRRETAIALGWLGRWEEALAEYRRVTEARTRLLGPDHPDTRSARADEAHCRERLGGGT
ncbi:serine/threonine-protein kinase [Streptomyces sp. NPDC126499]|uniref:serine/threonine-protein kinase n=1 Tax=Streptomyces sp. NPDC126499 TaxID=3155314 RepID=UPI0033261C77